MLVTWLPMVTERKSMQSWNALSGIFVKLAGNTALLRDVQPLNASIPIFVMLSANVTDVKFSQLAKARSPISTGPSSIDTRFTVESSKAPSEMMSTVFGR